ncbi:MAG: hypothetical protein QM237_08255 [Bacteroidota bacterium]|jgi:hypothetical protein|nr:hypothetical protein [Bacteroidota bacterium]HHU97476.1 hypothetical protein [Petrimonas sp.]
MKNILLYLSIVVAIFATGCTTFEKEDSLTLPDPPAVNISNINAQSEAISFNVSPAGTAGYYAWLVVEGEKIDATLKALSVLQQTASGVANGIAKYSETPDSHVVVEDLTPYTVYQIYAVVASEDGVVSEVKNASIRTLDDGDKPTLDEVAIEDTTVTITFHEPLQRGRGRVYVSYFAKNTVSGSKPLVVEPGFEEFNPQDIEVDEENLSVSGNTLVVQLPSAPAGAYASITYEADVVRDLEGNKSNAFEQKADTLVKGAPSGGITVRVATTTWSLQSEFEVINPDTLVSFSDWEELIVTALPDSGITVKKKGDEVPAFVYKEPGKFLTVDVKKWGLLEGIPSFFLPEAPAFGATVDLNIPAEAFEDVYGNTNEELLIEDNYLHSYGYTLDDITGTWQINGNSGFYGSAFPTETVVITEDPDSEDEFGVIITGFGKIFTGVDVTPISAIFDPVFGTLTIPHFQLLAEDVMIEVEEGVEVPLDVYFVTYNEEPVVFAVPSPGIITAASDFWGYGVADGDEFLGYLDLYRKGSTWERVSMETVIDEEDEEPTPSSVAIDNVPLLKTVNKLRR